MWKWFTKPTVALAIASLIIGLAIGVVGGRTLDRGDKPTAVTTTADQASDICDSARTGSPLPAAQSPQPKNDRYQQGWDAANALLEIRSTYGSIAEADCKITADDSAEKYRAYCDIATPAYNQAAMALKQRLGSRPWLPEWPPPTLDGSTVLADCKPGPYQEDTGGCVITRPLRPKNVPAPSTTLPPEGSPVHC